MKIRLQEYVHVRMCECYNVCVFCVCVSVGDSIVCVGDWQCVSVHSFTHSFTHSLIHSLTHSFTQQVVLKQQPGTIQGDRNTAVNNQGLYTCAHKAYVLEEGE